MSRHLLHELQIPGPCLFGSFRLLKQLDHADALFALMQRRKRDDAGIGKAGDRLMIRRKAPRLSGCQHILNQLKVLFLRGGILKDVRLIQPVTGRQRDLSIGIEHPDGAGTRTDRTTEKL